MAAWFQGTKEGADDVAIYGSRRVNGIWSAPVKLAGGDGEPHWNPVLLTRHDGSIMLFYKVGRQISEWYTRIKLSRDNGLTWTDSAELVPGDRGGRGPVRNKVVVLSNGVFLAPASTEKDQWKAFVDRSEDSGVTWSRTDDIAIKDMELVSSGAINSDIPVSPQSFTGRGVIQPTIWESENGHVHMLLRSSEGHIYRSDSADYGKSWCDAYPTELPNNNSGIDLARLPDGRLVLAMNPIGINWGPRSPIVLRVSADNGSTWRDELVMENIEGEFSYPSVNTDGSYVYVTYTWKREKIAFLKLSLS